MPDYSDRTNKCPACGGAVVHSDTHGIPFCSFCNKFLPNQYRTIRVEVNGAHHEALPVEVRLEICGDGSNDLDFTKVTFHYPVGGGDLDDPETLFMIFRACADACLAAHPSIFWDVPASEMAKWRGGGLQATSRSLNQPKEPR